MKILLVEDNLLNQKVVMYNLKKYNYAITTVTNGDDAMVKIENNKFDLVLMDIMLPGMNGYEITREIRKFETDNNIGNAVPIIALTANTLDNDDKKCIDAGMNDYLSKPFTSEQLISKIENLLLTK